MNKYLIGTIVVLLAVCLSGLGYLGYANYQLRQQLADIGLQADQQTAAAPSPAGQAPATPDSADPFLSGQWDPLAEIERMQQRMQQMMGQGGNSGGLFDFGNGQSFTFQSLQPDITLGDNGDAYEVDITIPEGSDIELNTEVEGRQFTVSGKITTEKALGSGASRHSMMSSSSFSRTFTLGEEVDSLGLTRETRGDTMVIVLPKIG